MNSSEHSQAARDRGIDCNAHASSERRMEMKYKHHQENSRKGFVHLVYDLYGRGSALALGRHLQLENPTVVGWCRDWERGDEASIALEKAELRIEERA
jgi:hypothetical protein